MHYALTYNCYSMPEEARAAKWKDIVNMIEPLGLHVKRAKMIITEILW